MRAIAAISFVWQKSISDDIECKMEEGNFTKIAVTYMFMND